jgi:amidohydrolase
VFVKEGSLMAGSDDLEIQVLGRSSHAALPHEGVDAIALAAQGIVAAQQTVSRRLSPMENGVVTFGQVEGGTAPNVVADRVILLGTARYFSDDVRRRLHDGIRAAFQGLRAQGCSTRVEIKPGYPPLINEPVVTEAVRTVAREVAGDDDVWEAEPMMGAEDFAILAREAPGAFVWLGAALPDAREHHHPKFDIDESVLPLAAALLARCGSALLELKAPPEGGPGPESA